MSISEQTYRQVALEDPEGHWELYSGEMRRKPGMTAEHNFTTVEVGYQLRQQLDPEEFQVRVNMGHVRWSSQHYYIPDVLVIPTRLVRTQLGHTLRLMLRHRSQPITV